MEPFASFHLGGGYKGGGKNYTGNHSRQKAEELGLSLSESTYETLARMPLRRGTASLLPSVDCFRPKT